MLQIVEKETAKHNYANAKVPSVSLRQVVRVQEYLSPFIIFSLMENSNPFPSLEAIDTYPIPELLIPRMMKVYGYSQETAQDLVREAKRMLALHIRTKKGINPSLKVDDAWHEMLMFTRFYKEFADFIGGYVHHNPTPPGQKNKTKSGESLYESTKKNYEETFGLPPDPRYWG